MPKLTIDNKEVEVPAGWTILQAAGKLGITIPTLCHLQGEEPLTSCFVCLVRVNGKLVPSCATPVTEGMAVESECPDVLSARRTALELLLSDHVGDCVGPCHAICPARMNIPLMIRQIAAGDMAQAIATVKRDIPLPAVLGRICPAPCERGCRRAQRDHALSIMLLKRFVADSDLASPSPYMPPKAPPSGKRVAVVGAGPTGLSAAYYILAHGHQCVVIDDHELAGGGLRYGGDGNDPAAAALRTRLPQAVLDAEIAVIARMGAAFRCKTRVGRDVSLSELRGQFDAVVIAVGEVSGMGVRPMSSLVSRWREDADKTHGRDAHATQAIPIDHRTYQTAIAGVFCGGDAARPTNRMSVRAIADGKAIAQSIDQYLRLGPAGVAGQAKLYTTHIGHLKEGEIELFMAARGMGAPPKSSSVTSARKQGEEAHGQDAHATRSRTCEPAPGLAAKQAGDESLRCLHCDCAKADNCRLRDFAAMYDARPAHFKAARRTFEYHRHGEIVYEPGKCIACGLCIRIAQRLGEPLGLTFVGRGFNVRVAVPFGKSLSEGLQKCADECVLACPTGALAKR
jgi:ferredoxin